MPMVDWDQDPDTNNLQSCVLGLDLGATSLRIARLGLSGGAFIRVPTPAPVFAAAILANKVREIVGDLKVESVGLSRAPSVDESGTVEQWPSRPEWRGSPVISWISIAAAGRIPISVDDGLCAAFWEHQQQATLDAGAITACLSIGTGLGVGIVDKRGFLTTMGGADTLGHYRFGSVTLTCKCGKTGCLQTLFSADGLEYALKNGMLPVLEDALDGLLKLLRSRYGVSYVVLTGGGVLKFGRKLFIQLFARIVNSCNMRFAISETPSMSALGGAFLLAPGSMGRYGSLWNERIKKLMTDKQCVGEKLFN